MALGDHPRRTPVYGGVLIVAAMVAGTAVTVTDTPVPLRVAVLVIAAIAAVVGFVMTFRDYS